MKNINIKIRYAPETITQKQLDDIYYFVFEKIAEYEKNLLVDVQQEDR